MVSSCSQYSVTSRVCQRSLCLLGIDAVRRDVGNDVVASESSILLPGNAFVLTGARVPETADNATALLLSVTVSVLSWFREYDRTS